MNDSHRLPLAQTRFLDDGVYWQPTRPSIFPRVIHFITSAAVIFLAGAVLIGWVSHV